jgi:Lar family restriction alleviation protein
MNKTVELLPCPFCGNDELTAEPETTYVMCHGCDADGPMTKPGEALKAWNSRPAPAEDVRAVGEEPVAYVMPSQIDAMQSIGWMHASRDRGRTGLEVALYRRPPRLGVPSECPLGYGHEGHWCGQEYNCWLDPRGRKERDEDFERRKSADSQRPVVLPKFNDWYAKNIGVLGTASAKHDESVWRACLDAVEELNK